MTWSAVIVLDPKTDLERAKRIFGKRYYRLSEMTSAYLQAQLRTGERCAVVESNGGYGGDDTPLGAFNRSRPLGEGGGNLTRKTRKLREKGWSDARISKWLTQKQGASDRAKRDAEKKAEEYASLGQDWVLAIREILDEAGADYIGLLVHAYIRDAEHEKVNVRRREVVDEESMDRVRLLVLEEDVVYEVRAK